MGVNQIRIPRIHVVFVFVSVTKNYFQKHKNSNLESGLMGGEVLYSFKNKLHHDKNNLFLKLNDIEGQSFSKKHDALNDSDLLILIGQSSHFKFLSSALSGWRSSKRRQLTMSACSVPSPCSFLGCNLRERYIRHN